MEKRQIDVTGLQAVLDALRSRGFTIIGPTVKGGAIVNGPVSSVSDFPIGWGDEQEAGRYRLRSRGDAMIFGFAAGAQSAKPVFFPTSSLLWTGSSSGGDGFEVTDRVEPSAGPYALIGVRSCDLSAIGIHDTVLGGRRHVDDSYVGNRSDAFIVAVTCTDPAGTCFCVSMNTGPSPIQGRGAPFDLSLTELLDESGHRFVVEVGSERGEELLQSVGAQSAAQGDVVAAERVVEVSSQRMGRSLETTGLKDLLYASVDSPIWDQIATRCLACTNCTAVCPTCFCTNVEDVTDLTGESASRHRVWDSCFRTDFSYIHGGSVRASTKARYRQWMTHKLASWEDQFGMSGCVGCGRCVTWCPVGIDITAEAAAIRAESASGAASAAVSSPEGQ
jgi:ferredoxin